jgi:Polyketide cyclase / dehydrase and lipid transport
MRKKLLIALAAVAAVLAAFAVVVAMQPSEFRVARSAIIFAPAPDVFAQVNDFHNWEAWSPWAKLDPNAKVSFAGPHSGEGAIFTWSGNSKVGEGRMTLIESKPAERIRIKLDFVKPMEGTSIAQFVFTPQGESTAVTWSMTGHNNFIAKAVCLFMNMDRMIGGDFEQGLVNLRAVVEGARKT